MSNASMPIATMVDPVVDFTSKASYLATDNKVDSAFFNQVPVQNYSSSLISVKLNLSNALSQILDRVIILNCPVKFDITGQRKNAVGTPNLLVDQEWGCRSNSFLKAINVATVNLGASTSYSFQSDSGILINALEASAPMPAWSRQLNNIDNQMVDNCASYDDALYTNRSVLGLYNNNSGNEVGRGAFDVEILTNTPTSASILVTYRFALFVAPLLQDIRVNGGSHGLSHIDSVNLNFALTNLPTRLLSFARNTNNGKLLISNIQPSFGPNFAGVPQPVLEFTTYNIISSHFQLPPQVSYKLPVIDRFSNLITVEPEATAVVSSPVVSLNTVPSYALIFATYPESLYSSQGYLFGQDADPIHGTQLTDAFCPISQVNAQINSVNQMNNSTSQMLWKSYVNNGGSKTFVEWSGRRVLKTLLDGAPKYMYPASGPVKLDFGTDLHVRAPDGTSLSAGTNFKFNASFTVQLKNTLPYTNQLVLYVCYCYPQIVQLDGVNNGRIISAPLSVEDNLSFKGMPPTAHAASLNSHDLVGYGLAGKLHRLMSSARMAHKLRKSRYYRKHLKDTMSGGMVQHMPEMSALAMHGAANVVGNGVSGGKMPRMKKHSRKGAVRF
jgi:hypothetical protein